MTGTNRLGMTGVEDTSKEKVKVNVTKDSDHKKLCLPGEVGSIFFLMVTETINVRPTTANERTGFAF